ncbi:hypothetical protein [Burkholderia aenigmatica]|uniref:hypothetical protein n=1 Tax=Burkholderia aenigmatica TaxID=2015348 RepID=UPI003B439143
MMRIFGYIVLGCLVFVFCFGSALSDVGDEVIAFSGSSTKIKVRCRNASDRMDCGIYMFRGGDEREILNFPGRPNIVSFDSGVFVIVFPCGTQCSATYFYSERNGLGGPFPFVEAYDVSRGVVLLSKRNPLPMYSIFSKKSRIVGEINLNLPKGVEAFASIKRVVVNDHGFIVSYVDRGGSVVKVSRQIPMLEAGSMR